ncbi:hypothetical protein PPSIR1_21099 [Plesiocystis pacifica SIR-1]|uniref:Uncharacterized protein n=1 Tax=Plesiocystis pacifica SIR-1 TaxID=391625 RepID=A6G3F9_9BACT|nr:peptidoglycan-binding domain-containing protein [Plesiocystis pacifica]EDM79566.1 hypothetical protein PPSIR1_21099 [Plesiocystis pacifica SIR-1]
MNARTMTPQQRLRKLGYTTSAAGIREFQADFNRFAAQPLLRTGVLDAETIEALELAYCSREVFEDLRDSRDLQRNRQQRGGRHSDG